MLFQRAGAIEYIVAGLGNPGKKYEATRHNAGFVALDALAAKNGIRVDRVKWNALTGDGTIAGKRVLLMKPQTFMNLSGEAVWAAMCFYKIPPEHVIVMFDDISLEPGKLRIRRKGSCGGHNGMRSVIDYADSEEFPRVKLGIGAKPRPEYDLADWVTSYFTLDERKQLERAAESAAQAVELILDGNFNEAMNKFN